jgi:hypothetical protein
MGFDFEQFTEVSGSYAPKLSIRNTGQIGLSQGLLRRVGIGDGQWYALLYFDKKQQAIGVKFTQEENARGAVKVQKRATTSADGGKNWNGHIPARAFLDYCGIEFRGKKSQGYLPEFGEGGMVIVVLGSGTDEDDPPEEDEAGGTEEQKPANTDVGTGSAAGE